MRKPLAASTVKIALVQSRADASPQENLDKAAEQIRRAAKKGARIVCLQELFRTPYFPQVEDAANFALAEPLPGPTTQALGAVAKQEKIVIVAPVFEKRAQGVYHNSAAVIDADGSIVGKYRKMHVPDDPEFYEKFYFAPGDLGFQAFDTRFGRIGVLICWDQWYPEAARLTALSGAQVLFYPTAIGHHTTVPKELARKQHDAWETVQRGHAIANGVFVAAPNRVGREDKLNFWGQSFVCGPFGEVLAKASDHQEELLLAECDLGEIDRVRHGWPFLRDRRVDAYGPITARYLDEPAR